MLNTSSETPRVRYVDVEDQVGQRIDNFLFGKLKGVPKSRIYRMIRSGEVRINGSRCKASTKLAFEDRIRIPPVRVAKAQEDVRASQGVVEQLQQSVIYQDADILVLDKPSGLAVHGGSGQSFGLAEILKQVFEVEGLQLVHRLDKDTSGCLLIAKNRTSMNRLNELFRGSQIGKTYALLVEGQWDRSVTCIEAPLERFQMSNGERRMCVKEGGQASRTDITVLHRKPAATWLNASPITGRTHQIRVHAQHVEHPVIGDRKYGSRVFKPSAKRLMLHSQKLEIPNLGMFESPIPKSFQRYWDLIESKSAG